MEQKTGLYKDLEKGEILESEIQKEFRKGWLVHDMLLIGQMRHTVRAKTGQTATYLVVYRKD
jgi:hypothetical protein